MTRAVAFALALLPLTACPQIDYEIIPQWMPSPLERLGCDPADSIGALPEDRPVAVCSASNVEMNPIFDETNFMGQESYDPNGNPIVDYQWTLVETPTGSTAPIGEGVQNRYGFSPDMAGNYIAQLIVTNDQCVMSDPCEVSIRAVPAEDLWIEMHWEKPGDDMDLHLVEGPAAVESDGDCYYGNCVESDYGPDFGDGNFDGDDPHLDLDDIDGTGPENINVYAPASGIYKVIVHDYPGSVRQGDNDVTVKIHLAGELVFEETRTISGEDKYVPFAEIEWPTMAVRSL